MKSYRIGRSTDNNLVINHALVSRSHATVEKSDGLYYLIDNSSSNGTYVNNLDAPINRTRLTEDDIVYFSTQYSIPARLLIRRLEQGREPASDESVTQLVSGQTTIRIGRAPDNTIVLNSLHAADYHAEIRILADGSRIITDLGTPQGIYLNNQLLKGASSPIRPTDRIEIGGIAISTSFTENATSATSIAASKESLFVQMESAAWSVKDHSSKNIRQLIDNIDLVIYPGEFIGLMGPSGCGKTSLVDLLSGVQTPTSGVVRYNGINLHTNLDRLSSQIGYVTQDDIMHPELTVREVLYYNARRKLPSSVSDDDIHEKIITLCNHLGIREQLETIVGSTTRKTLSGGQKKRVNIAIELLTDPRILYLDEPTSGLSSRDARIVMQLLLRLARDKGIAVIVSIHQPSLMLYRLLDKIIYLKAGKLCYFGPAFPDSVLYFEPEKPAELSGPDAVIERLDVLPENELHERYSASEAHRKFIDERMKRLAATNLDTDFQNTATNVPGRVQFRFLLKRYLTCKGRDWMALGIAGIQAIFIGLLVGLVFNDQYPANTPLFLLAFIALWFGTNNAAREIVAEQGILRRERRSGLNMSAYLFSKIIGLGLISLVQCAVVLAIALPLSGLSIQFGLALFICFITALVGTSIGLLISAMVKTEVAAIAAIPLVLIPFILLGGVMVAYSDLSEPIRWLSELTPSRWSYEAMITSENIALGELSADRLKTLRDSAASSGKIMILPFSSSQENTDEYRLERLALSLAVLSLYFVAVSAATYKKLKRQ